MQPCVQKERGSSFISCTKKHKGCVIKFNSTGLWSSYCSLETKNTLHESMAAFFSDHLIFWIMLNFKGMFPLVWSRIVWRRFEENFPHQKLFYTSLVANSVNPIFVGYSLSFLHFTVLVGSALCAKTSNMTAVSLCGQWRHFKDKYIYNIILF